jgi:hypothetical protein
MQSDIHLNGNWLVLEGTWIKLRSLDLMLDSPSRRRNNTGHRRALVHDPQDGLTINYAKDYPGGVTIQGEVSLETVKVQGEVSLKGPLSVESEIKLGNTLLAGLKDVGTSRQR